MRVLSPDETLEHAMERYDFEIVTERGPIVVERDVAVPDQLAMWTRIAKLARKLGGAPGKLIRVTNEKGVVVLVGVSTALTLCADIIANLPQR
ncbi:MAG: hypothetical protein KGM42_02075 [Hyphomicrobiales bacterium]|nr:hypothetical protein [Hyphomicrobiales bacterium]